MREGLAPFTPISTNKVIMQEVPSIAPQVRSEIERRLDRVAHEDGVRAAIPQIGAEWFGLQPPRNQGNMLSDMMASLFGGQPSAGQAGEQQKQQQQIKGAGAPPKPLAPTSAAAGSSSGQAAAAPSAVADDLVDDEMD